jgi:hypothetical protein
MNLRLSKLPDYVLIDVVQKSVTHMIAGCDVLSSSVYQDNSRTYDWRFSRESRRPR